MSKVHIPRDITGTLTVDATSGLWYDYFPAASLWKSQALVPPITERTGLPGGWLHSVTARVPTGGGITLGPGRFFLVKDLRTYPDGTTTGTATAKLAYSATPEERLLYAGASVTATPSATVADWADVLDQPFPFENGFWICFEHASGSGSGSVEVRYSIGLTTVGS